MTHTFEALRVYDTEAGAVARIESIGPESLSAGEVLVRVAYSSLNYKDALAVTGRGRILRGSPRIPGVDLSGHVLESSDPRFKVGDAVLATGYELGMAHDGGLAGYARVPADWVLPLPAGLTLRESMMLGTAGFTAALAVSRLEQLDLAPANGPVVVTGASGGVSMIVIDQLAALGYEVIAITSKPEQSDTLRALGAAEVLLRAEVDMGRKPLERARFAAAFDSVGGETLAWLTRVMQQRGLIAAYGNASGTDLVTTVFPFILRGVALVGIDSASTGMPQRQRVWQRLASDLKPRHLVDCCREITLSEVVATCQALVDGRHSGRSVVRLAGD
ncbi:MAG: acryloyl-CoA reductase [Betaproteobacteria bacterium]|nr:acryloyl-CoA reductase [Betaproteobacteria bacterium]